MYVQVNPLVNKDWVLVVKNQTLECRGGGRLGRLMARALAY